jgi:glycosyltransferase involved in cell wall biosynthesis
MAVFNGATNLQEQLESFDAQTYSNWSLFVSDDGSEDDTPQILAEFRRSHPDREIILVEGPRKGFAQNFLSALRRLPKRDRWVAFSDQDDVWLSDRLERGMAALQCGDETQPALYCSRTWITDANLGNRRMSLPRNRPAGFRNALVQNIAAGNTILLNPVASELVCLAAQEVGCVVAHDWWCYQLISGADGRVVHDTKPTLLYRQHADNEIGANDSFAARVQRAIMIISGQYQKWNDINSAAMHASYQRLSTENQRCLDHFDKMRRSGPLLALYDMWRMGLYRQTTVSTCALGLAVLLKKF